MKAKKSWPGLGLATLVAMFFFTMGLAQNSKIPKFEIPGLGYKLFFIIYKNSTPDIRNRLIQKLSEIGFKSSIKPLNFNDAKPDSICSNEFWLIEKMNKIDFADQKEIEVTKGKLSEIFNGLDLSTNSKDDTFYAANPISGFKPVTLGGGSEPIVNKNKLSEIKTELEKIQISTKYTELKKSLESVKIAVLDTGVSKHFSLPNKINGFNYSHTLNFGKSTVDRKLASDSNDWFNYIYEKNEYTDESKIIGHGTGIASLLIGNDPKHDFLGIAAGAKVIPIRICDVAGECGGFQLLMGICKAIEQDADIINLSLSGDKSVPAIKIALKDAVEKGITVVTASGNYSPDKIRNKEIIRDNLTEGNLERYPIKYADDTNISVNNTNTSACTRNQNSGIIGVGAVNQNGDGVADFSRRSKGISVVAPGENVRVANLRKGKPYFVTEGTSYSTAWVTGLVALMYAKNNLEGKANCPAEIVKKIQTTATPLPKCPTADCGKGLINFPRALDLER